jgi:hypothetical protein
LLLHELLHGRGAHPWLRDFMLNGIVPPRRPCRLVLQPDPSCLSVNRRLHTTPLNIFLCGVRNVIRSALFSGSGPDLSQS